MTQREQVDSVCDSVIELEIERARDVDGCRARERVK